MLHLKFKFKFQIHLNVPKHVIVQVNILEEAFFYTNFQNTKQKNDNKS